MYDRRHWLFGEHGVPTGFVKVAGTIRPDPSQRDLVRAMFRVLVSGLHSSTQADMLLGLGIWPQMPANPRAALWRKLRWAPLYVNGIWIQLLANPLAGVTEWMGLPVIPSGPNDTRGHFELCYRIGLPAGGWLDEDLAEAALRLLRAAQTRRTGGKRSYQPWAGSEWSGPIGSRPGDRDWRLSPGRGRYDVRVRPRSPQ
jgi:hypothetical protein